MDKHIEAELELRNSTREYLCNEHIGAKSLIQLFNTVQYLKEQNLISGNRITEIMDEILAEPPGFKDKKDLEATIAVKLMKFQHSTGRPLTSVHVTPSADSNKEFPSWTVSIKTGEN